MYSVLVPFKVGLVLEEEEIKDLAEALPFGQDIEEILKEYEERKSKEAIIAKDADNLEWLLSLKEQYDAGNSRAKKWSMHIFIIFNVSTSFSSIAKECPIYTTLLRCSATL